MDDQSDMNTGATQSPPPAEPPNGRPQLSQVEVEARLAKQDAAIRALAQHCGAAEGSTVAAEVEQLLA